MSTESERLASIPALCFDALRAVHASRAYRNDHDATVPNLSNKQIFLLMPDNGAVNWNRDEQQPLIDATLAAMWDTVSWSDANGAH